jgi:NADP-dependent 3-hydroxy acid dehydrogenase YdfG
MTDLIDLAGKSVIVTGASSGIGASTARLLHAAGAHPVLAARRADRLAALSEELDGALAVPTDVTDPARVRDLAAAALDRHQRIDGLVNNAGASLHGPLDQVDLTEFSQVLQLNVVGLLAVTQAVLPAMRAQGFGRIVNISSGTTRRVAVGVGV